jgi:hypothetical protein
MTATESTEANQTLATGVLELEDETEFGLVTSQSDLFCDWFEEEENFEVAAVEVIQKVVEVDEV